MRITFEYEKLPIWNVLWKSRILLLNFSHNSKVRKNYFNFLFFFNNSSSCPKVKNSHQTKLAFCRSLPDDRRLYQGLALHKTFWGARNKFKNKNLSYFFFSLRPGLGKTLFFLHVPFSFPWKQKNCYSKYWRHEICYRYTLAVVLKKIGT